MYVAYRLSAGCESAVCSVAVGVVGGRFSAMTILHRLVAFFPPWMDDTTIYLLIGVWVGGMLVVLFPPWRKKRRKKTVS